jgi:hypothetical protein
MSVPVGRHRRSAPTPDLATTGFAPGGRGLIIVEALAASWGCTPVRDGKLTWATLPIHPQDARA